MLPFLSDKTCCTGCSACQAACPVDCISMITDDEGFWYPSSSEKCINCGRCAKVCPSFKAVAMTTPLSQKAYACLSKDDTIWRRSASGGAFSEICIAWGDERTIVVGATWDGFRVHHVCIKGVGNIKPICKSKYIASNPDNVFRKIKGYLEEGQKVVFCGVPCQVAGLKSFLIKDYSNLLTIDLICHGVGSPAVFESVVHLLEEQFDGRISGYEFRAKRKNYEYIYLSAIRRDEKTIYIAKDPYMQLFLKQLCLRPSCGKHCKYRNRNRQGDLTIADFKGLEDVFPHLLGTKRNYSAIVTNSEKGKTVIPLLTERTHVLPCDISAIGKYNPLFERQTWFSEERNKFFNEYKINKEEAIKKWTVPATVFAKSIKQRLFDYLPVFVRRLYLTKNK